METGVETSAYHLYPVRSGDTLSTIARNYGIPLSSIIAANPNLDPDRIRIGQNIVIPLPPEAALAVKSAAAVDEPAPAFLGTHIVARGDTLWSIALKYSVQVELLAERNGLDIKSLIREGTSLHVPILETRP
jgi:membrane-bound lytic murein transglycosylase D